MEKQKSASDSTNYRYKKCNRTKASLSQFCQFRNEYENYISNAQIEQLKQVFHHGICGKNNQGNLIVVDRIGCIKMNEINKILDEDDIIGYYNQRLLRISEHLLQQRQQVIWIIDLSGKIMQLASKKTLSILSKIIKNLQAYFPDILHRIYLVNTPMLFDTIWSKFCSQICEDTQEKISDDVEKLYEEVEIAILPQFLGGEVDDQTFLHGFSSQNSKQNKQQDNKKDQQSEQQQFDFSSLKQALSGMKMGGSQLQSVSQTPLNTEADEK